MAFNLDAGDLTWEWGRRYMIAKRSIKLFYIAMKYKMATNIKEFKEDRCCIKLPDSPSYTEFGEVA